MCVAVLFLSSVFALADHEAPAPLVTAVATAAEIALPGPAAPAEVVADAVAPAALVPAGPATTAPPLTVPGVSVPGLPVSTPPIAVTVPTLPPPPPSTPAPAASTSRPTAGIAPYLGLGTWVDVYDWSLTYARGGPTVSPDHVDRMAEAGVQTLYIQASKHDAPTDVLEPDLLRAHIDRAKRRGLQVVVWYLPTLVDTARDLARLEAIAALPGIDGIAVDIEARNVDDVNVRNDRLVELSAALRKALPGRFIGGIVLPPVVLEVVNPNYWPAFPYKELAPHYDVWQTMGYWTNRKAESGYRDAYRYTRENVDRLRANLNAVVPVHPIGGLGAQTTPTDVEAYRRAVADTGSLGGSLYDWRTTGADAWPSLRQFRA